ncbi:MAG TPA: CBS domain-containing protein [Nannocystaceae bacterium]|nr:CBS domain-containing protein [Nannocystaceae bacterium]
MTPRPTVAQFMTSNPASADEGLLLADAQQRMFLDNIRHLVVLRSGQVVGVLSTRDVALALGLPGARRDRLTVRDAMSTHPYVCSPTTALADVALEMESHRYGCAIVVEDDDVIGVFTTTDALRALRELATGKRAEPSVKPMHLPPDEPDHARPFRIRRHRPIDAGSGQVFSTLPK